MSHLHNGFAYYTVQFHYHGPTDGMCTDDDDSSGAHRTLWQVDCAAETALRYLGVAWGHLYSWPDGSCYKQCKIPTTHPIINVLSSDPLGRIEGPPRDHLDVERQIRELLGLDLWAERYGVGVTVSRNESCNEATIGGGYVSDVEKLSLTREQLWALRDLRKANLDARIAELNAGGMEHGDTVTQAFEEPLKP